MTLERAARRPHPVRPATWPGGCVRGDGRRWPGQVADAPPSPLFVSKAEPSTQGEAEHEPRRFPWTVRLRREDVGARGASPPPGASSGLARPLRCVAKVGDGRAKSRTRPPSPLFVSKAAPSTRGRGSIEARCNPRSVRLCGDRVEALAGRWSLTRSDAGRQRERRGSPTADATKAAVADAENDRRAHEKRHPPTHENDVRQRAVRGSCAVAAVCAKAKTSRSPMDNDALRGAVREVLLG